MEHAKPPMPPSRSVRALLILSLFATLPAHADNWLVVSGASYHFRQDERDWREDNPGLGVELGTRHPDLYQVVGMFKNSYDRVAFHAGVRWMPVHWGPLRFGGYALASTGYPSAVLVLPGFAVEHKRVGMNVVVAPNIGDYSGYVGVQLRFRVD